VSLAPPPPISTPPPPPLLEPRLRLRAPADDAEAWSAVAVSSGPAAGHAGSSATDGDDAAVVDVGLAA